MAAGFSSWLEVTAGTRMAALGNIDAMAREAFRSQGLLKVLNRSLRVDPKVVSPRSLPPRATW